MTVKELIAKLQALDPDQQEMQVGIALRSGDTMDFTVEEAETDTGQCIMLEAD